MRISIMQPYIFPYIGYFQLIKASDIFVCLDDVNFIKKGWIHRNRLCFNGDASYALLNGREYLHRHEEPRRDSDNKGQQYGFVIVLDIIEYSLEKIHFAVPP